MTHSVLIAGGGIAGLAAAIGLARAGWQPMVCERAAGFAEVGAGVQLGPNVTRILNAWGAEALLKQVAFQPKQLVAHGLDTGERLASLSLQDMQHRYGAPYVTVHRADLHAVLLQLSQTHGAELRHSSHINRLVNQDAGVLAYGPDDQQPTTHHMAVVADGVWSQLRQQLLNDGIAPFTGHVAYRALVSQAALPATLRTQNVSVWMGANAHVVYYPVRGGEWLNVVCLIEDPHFVKHENANLPETWQRLQTWNSQNTFEQTQRALKQALRGAHSHIHQLIEHCVDWRLWPLCGRHPLKGVHHMAQGCIALVGDAAHPMLPYLAQGAGMAIEDAAVLESVFQSNANADVSACLNDFANQRWQRNARVQARAIRNGNIFHATGAMRWARDAGLRLMGASLMDVPWLYGYNAGKL